MSDRPTRPWSLRLVRDSEGVEEGEGVSSSPTLAQIAESYYSKLRVKRSSEENIRHSQRNLERLLRGLAVGQVCELSKARIDKWRQGRILAGASNTTVNHEVSLLCAALNHAVRLGLIEVSPLQGLEKLPMTARHRVRRAHALTDAEIGKLLSAAQKIDRKCKHGSFPREPTLRGLLATGARWNELIQATWADLDFDHGSLTLRAETTKTQRARTIPLAPSDFAAVLALRDVHVRIKGEIPTSANRIFLAAKGEPWAQHTQNFLAFLHAAMRAAEIPYRDSNGKVIHVHALRHTAATRWARQGVPLLELQRLLGHTDPKMTTQVYIDANLEVARQWILPLPFPE